MTGDVDTTWAEEVLTFWFGEVPESQWFAGDAALDARIRERFGALHGTLLRSEGAGLTGARPLLAAVIVLDQFSRNMYRDTPQAFAADPLARRLASAVLDQGLDSTLAVPQRLFLTLPFQHSENSNDQACALARTQALGDANWVRHAASHKAIIDRFGRFPHRNHVLGRTSTEEELAFLQAGSGPN